MQRTNPFAPFAEVREAILNVRAQSDSTAHPSQQSQRERQYRQMLSQGVHRSPFTVRRSAFGVRRSAEEAKRPALPLQLRRPSTASPLGAQAGTACQPVSKASRLTSSAPALLWSKPGRLAYRKQGVPPYLFNCVAPQEQAGTACRP